MKEISILDTQRYNFAVSFNNSIVVKKVFMKKLLTYLGRYYHISYLIFILLASILLLYLIIPGGSRFRYEFQKNAPWRHETLIAPFNFAILKPQEEIQHEKDSLTSRFIPYFSKDSLISGIQPAQFKKSLEQLNQTDSVPISATAIHNLSSFLADIYQQGIVDQSPDNYPILKNKSNLFIIDHKVARKSSVSKVYSLKTAYQALSDSARSLLKHHYDGLVHHINMVDFLTANLSYNEDINQHEKQKLLDGISTTQGMVQSGERIIFKGDIVTPQKFLILNSLKKSYETKRGQDVDHYLIIVGKIILIISCLLILILYLLYFRREIFNHKRHLSFILLLLILMVFVSSFISKQSVINIYIVPLAILPILIRIFFDSRTAIFVLMVASLLVGYFAPNNYEFIFLHLIAGIIAVFSLNKLHRRSHLVFTAIWVLLSYSITFLALSMIQEGNWESIHWEDLQWFAGNALLILLAYPLIYIFEKLFGFTSDVTLIELSNTNQPLLRKLAEEAPGTFQHSLQVANLAEAVIYRIGGNPFLAYAGALYHDIGKTNQPVYFIENQSAGMNPHNDIDYRESARIIIDHVTYGVKLAHRHKLPEVLVDFITSHHGTMKAQYFYTMYKNEHPDEAIDPREFTYPGPPPQSKETAVVMLIDGIEAATRSLPEKTPENIRNLIQEMIQKKINEGQLDQADLTLRDIQIVKKTLLEKLINIYHIRIAYPKEK